ncbi:hypothetical protein pb186bvf_012433 [Paramecium bursaria]
MKLSTSLYQMFVQLKVFEPKQTQATSIPLTDTQSILIENGIAIGKLLKALFNQAAKQSQRPLTPLPQLDQLKTITTASTKLYNWNILLEAMKQLQVPYDIDPDIKKMILMGDPQILEDICNKIYGGFQQNTIEKKIIKLNSSTIKNKPQEIQPSQSNTLEFFTNLLAKHLGLQSKQVISLYADNNKYLAQVITKGVQRVYEPIINFYDEIFTQTDHLLSLIQEEPDKGLKFALQILKTGLVSKSQDVALCSIKVLGKLVIVSVQKRLQITKLLHEWYILNGLQTNLLAIKRHPQLVDSLVDLLLLFCKNNLVELFTQTLKQNCANQVEYLTTLDKLYGSLNEETLLELNSSGLLAQMIEQSLDTLENIQIKIDERIQIMRLIVLIWQKFYDQFEQHQQRVYNILKMSAQEQSQSVSLMAITFLFQMLEHFGQRKIKEAPFIYKCIALLLVECKQEQQVSFILNNLLHLFNQIPSIPIGVILDPFIGALQQLTYPSLVVFNFIVQISAHPSLSAKSNVQLLDLLSKIAIYDTVHYQIANSILIRIIQNSIDNETTIEFLGKFAKVSLAVYLSVYKKKDNIKIAQKQIVERQRCAQIIEVLKMICNIHNQYVNQVIKTLAGHTNLQFKLLYGKLNNGLNSLLHQLGNLDDIMLQVQTEYEDSKLTKQAYSESSIKEIKDVQSNLKKFTKLKLTKEEQYHLASLRIPRNADPKVLDDINQIKVKYQNQQETKIKQKELNEIQEKQLKIQVRQQLEKRQIEQGVALYNKQDVEVKLIYEDGSRMNELKKEKKTGLTIFEIIDLSLEEDFEKQLVDQLLLRYHKVLKFIFNKYGNSSLQQQLNTSFEQLQQKTKTIHVSEISKFIRDFEINFTSEQIQSLARQVQVQILHNKTEFKEFDFQTFTQIFVQLSIIIAGPQVQPYISLQRFISYLRQITASKKMSTALFDDPDSQYFKESDIIREFNKKLLEDPEFQLPDAYKKVGIPQLSFVYQLKVIPDEQAICYEIISDLIQNTFGMHIIEPVTEQVVVYKARPDAFGYIQSKLQNDSQEKDKKVKDVIQPRKKVLEIEPKRELTLNMKLEISKFNFRERPIAEAVGNLLDDMLYAIEHNKQSLERTNIITNKAMQEKKQQELKVQQEQMFKEQKRKEREKEIKKKITDNRDMSLQKIMAVEKEKLIKLKTEGQHKSKEKEKRSQYLDDLKSKIRDHSEQLKNEQLKQLLIEKEIKEKEERQKKEQFKQFNSQQIEKLRKSKEDEKQQQKLQNDKLKEELLKQKTLLERARSKIQTVDQSRIKQEKQINQQIIEKFKSAPIQKVISQYGVALQVLFQFLVNETYFVIGQNSRDQINYKTFSWFADRFNFSPEVISRDDITRIYRFLTKDKEIIDKVPVGMKYDEFLLSLFIISLKGSDIFNKVALKISKKDGKVNIKNIQQIVEQEQKQLQSKSPDQLSPEAEPKSQSPQAQSIIEETPARMKSKSQYIERDMVFKQSMLIQTNEHTFEAFILYLDISNDKNQLDLRFRKALEEKKVPNKVRKQFLQDKLGIYASN